jgi:S1-C subfamily serine protease
MSIQFDIRSGVRAGHTVALDKAYLTVGRHAQSDLRFDDHDLAVSVRHAAIVRREGRYLLRDLGSTNGTFVNGKRVLGDCPLSHGDVIEVGAAGPRAVISFVPVQLDLAMDGAPEEPYRPSRPEPRLRPTPSTGITAAGIEAVARRRTMAVRRHVASAVAIVVVIAAGLFWRHAHPNPAAGDEVLLRRPERGAPAVATVDVARVARANRSAVGLVSADFGEGGTFSGTGFVIRSEGGYALIVTARHLVNDPGGAPAARIGFVLNGTSRTLSAELVAAHPTADLALLRVKTSGLTPVHTVAKPKPAAEGDAVALLGFPLGLDLPMGGDWRRVGLSATSGAATVTRVLPTLIQIDGYGAQGSSGSPVFDRSGNLVAVLYGSERESAGRILYAVPMPFVSELLRRTPASR